MSDLGGTLRTETSDSTPGLSVGDWPKSLNAYAMAMVAQVPLLSMYAIELWRRVHYQFFPIAIAFTIYVIWKRWPSSLPRVLSPGWLGRFCLMIALLSGIAGAAFVEPWFAAVSTVALTMALASRVRDEATGRTLLGSSLALLPCIYLPGGFDGRLISGLQRVSATCTSRLLDMLGFAHHMNGTVIEAHNGRVFGVAEACSGVTSFFMLLFCALAISVWMRRRLGWTIALSLSACYWAILMNTIRILAIPLADSFLSIDLSEGILHDVLGYTTMLLGFGLLISTDQFLSWCVVRFAGNRQISTPGGHPASNPNSESRIGTDGWFTWSICGVLMVGGIFSLSDVYRNYRANERYSKVRFFDSDVRTELDEQDLPAQISDWKLTRFGAEDRSRGSDFGEHSDVWTYAGPQCFATVSLDQPFPGWHELTTCYTLVGWRMRQRTIITDAAGVDGQPWPLVEAQFDRDDGARAYLLFSFFDNLGRPCEPPPDWGAISQFVTRAQNRLSDRIRSSLFQGSMYQSQLFIVSEGEMAEETRRDAMERYLQLRETMRIEFLEKRAISGNQS